MPENNPEISVELFEKVALGQADAKELLGFDNDDLETIAQLGADLFDQGRYKEATTIFSGLTALDPDYYKGYAGMGVIALAQEPPMLDDAAAFLEKACSLQDSDPSTYSALGEAYLRLGKYEDAANILQRAMELDPNEEDPGAERARAIVEGLEELIEVTESADKATA